VTINVGSLKAAGHAYARARRLAKLPVFKGTAVAMPQDTGPVLIKCNGHTYTLFINGTPAPC